MKTVSWQQLGLTIRSRGEIVANVFLEVENTSRELTYRSFSHGTFESMIFLFPRWDMLVPWRVYTWLKIILVSEVLVLDPKSCVWAMAETAATKNSCFKSDLLKTTNCWKSLHANIILEGPHFTNYLYRYITTHNWIRDEFLTLSHNLQGFFMYIVLQKNADDLFIDRIFST